MGLDLFVFVIGLRMVHTGCSEVKTQQKPVPRYVNVKGCFLSKDLMFDFKCNPENVSITLGSIQQYSHGEQC